MMRIMQVCKVHILSIAALTAVLALFSCLLFTADAEAYSETDVVYTEGITGGAVYFDKSTGTITDCDESVTAAVIPASIEDVEVTAIGDGAFWGCMKMETIVLPESLTSIGTRAFRDSGILSASIPEGVVSLESETFYNCFNLKSVDISSTVVNINITAFNECNLLEVINVNDNNKNYADLDGVLFDKKMECLYKYPANKSDVEYNIPDSVISTYSYAFRNSAFLEIVNLPENFESIGEATFYKCSVLKTINMSDSVNEIGSRTFDGCSSLKYIIIPVKIKTIGSLTFHGCESLESITIPNNVESISSTAFGNCSSLINIDVDEQNECFSSESGVLFDKDKSHIIKYPEAKQDITYVMPESVVSIGINAFADCKNLQNIKISYALREMNNWSFGGCSQLDNVEIPSGVEIIPRYAFTKCSSLKSITLSEGLTSIDDYAFCDCDSLIEIIIPYGTESLGEGVFINCTNLKKVVIPSSVTKIGNQIFTDSPDAVIYGESGSYAETYANNNSITFIPFQTISYEVDNGYIYFDKETGTVVSCDSAVTAAVIPEIIDDIAVTSIGKRAFDSCGALISVTLPESLTAIGDEAFDYCYNLTGIAIPAGVETIGNNAFISCYAMTEITVAEDNKKYCSENGILYDKNKTRLIMYPDSKTDTDFDIPQGVADIGDYAFSDCKYLNVINIPDTVINIGSGAFSGCSGISSMVIPDSVTSIGTDAFKECPELMIYGDSGSTAEMYAYENSIPFTSLSQKEDPVIPDKKDQIIVASDFDKTYGDNDFSLNASAQTPLSYKSLNTDVAEVSGDGTVTIKSAGTAVIEIKAAETDEYNDAAAQVTVTVAKATQSIKSVGSYTRTYGCAPFVIEAAAETTVSYKSSNSSVASVSDDGIVTVKAGGKTKIIITASESDKYKSAVREVLVTVNRAAQSISCKSSIARTFGYNSSFSLGAISKTKKSYKSSNTKIATVSAAGKVVMKNPGKVTITITATSTSQYNSAVKKVTFTSSLKKPVLVAKAYSGKKIKLTWSKVPGASGYKIYIYDPAKKKYVCRLTKGASVKSVTHKGLKAGRTYKYKVRAYRIVNGTKVYSSYSTVKSVKAKR